MILNYYIIVGKSVKRNKLATLALHLSGASLTRKFRFYAEKDFIETGLILYGKKFEIYLDYSQSLFQKYTNTRISILSILDNDYPETLKKSLNPPLCLFTMGDIELLQKDCVSIVGTRKASIVTSIYVKYLSRALSANEYILVSGLAHGIDSLVHANSVEYGTIGILPHSLDFQKPAGNEYLFKKAMNRDKVLLLSEYPEGTKTRKYFYVHRNRIIAGISNHIIIAEAGENSGALITANYAYSNHRKVYVFYHDLQKNNQGGHKLIKKQHAVPLEPNFKMEILNSSLVNINPCKSTTNYFYIGNEYFLVINDNCFSTEFLKTD